MLFKLAVIAAIVCGFVYSIPALVIIGFILVGIYLFLRLLTVFAASVAASAVKRSVGISGRRRR